MPPKQAKRDLYQRAVQSVDLGEGWMQRLLELEKDDLALILGEIANQSNITNSTIKRARTTLSSFSVAKWVDFAEKANLQSDPEFLALKPFVTPSYPLPPSFHEAVVENSWRTQDVYREKADQTRDEARVRLLDTYIIPILALFRGRIIDRPELTMPETEYSTGGAVEHEIFMIGGVLLFIKELKFDRPTPDNLA